MGQLASGMATSHSRGGACGNLYQAIANFLRPLAPNGFQCELSCTGGRDGRGRSEQTGIDDAKHRRQQIKRCLPSARCRGLPQQGPSGVLSGGPNTGVRQTGRTLLLSGPVPGNGSTTRQSSINQTSFVTNAFQVIHSSRYVSSVLEWSACIAIICFAGDFNDTFSAYPETLVNEHSFL